MEKDERRSSPPSFLFSLFSILELEKATFRSATKFKNSRVSQNRENCHINYANPETALSAMDHLIALIDERRDRTSSEASGIGLGEETGPFLRTWGGCLLRSRELPRNWCGKKGLLVGIAPVVNARRR